MTTAMFQSSGDLIADRRYTFARELAERGDMAGAADLLVQTAELAPEFAAAWFALGEAREALGQCTDAVSAFRKTLVIDPHDHHGAGLRLIRLGAEPIVGMPAHYVRAVFDQYAAQFDAALVQGLGYRAPQLLFDAVQQIRTVKGQTGRIGRVLDLGCGTGLGGVAFRPCSDWLVGVDLSANMLARAQTKELYDRLVVGDILEFLAAERVSGRFHLVLAADVFAYFADLHDVVAAASRVLEPGGLLAFTVETHASGGVILGEKLRCAHGVAHVRSALDAAALDLVSLEELSARNEAGAEVPGLVAVAQRPR